MVGKSRCCTRKRKRQSHTSQCPGSATSVSQSFSGKDGGFIVEHLVGGFFFRKDDVYMLHTRIPSAGIGPGQSDFGWQDM